MGELKDARKNARLWAWIIVRDLIFWAMNLIASAIMFGLSRLFGAEPRTVRWGFAAASFVICVFYLLKLVTDMYNLLTDP